MCPYARVLKATRGLSRRRTAVISSSASPSSASPPLVPQPDQVHSTDEGLEQGFNSLDAQRQSAQASSSQQITLCSSPRDDEDGTSGVLGGKGSLLLLPFAFVQGGIDLAVRVADAPGWWENERGRFTFFSFFSHFSGWVAAV
jgi:hypothetical protein